MRILVFISYNLKMIYTQHSMYKKLDILQQTLKQRIFLYFNNILLSRKLTVTH